MPKFPVDIIPVIVRKKNPKTFKTFVPKSYPYNDQYKHMNKFSMPIMEKPSKIRIIVGALLHRKKLAEQRSLSPLEVFTMIQKFSDY